MSHRIAILGSTGSIGCNAVDVVEHLGEPYQASALSANSNIDKLVEQARRCRSSAVAIVDEQHFAALRSAGLAASTSLYFGQTGLCQMVERDDIDLVLAAIVGAAGVQPVLSAVRAGKTLALANKEALVVAGCLVMPEARKRGVTILPVDSEHSAVFQAMHCGKRAQVKRVILTASGGPFRSVPLQQMHRATLADALKHPTWSMGTKVTVDSATMFNKALEVIEACWLFDLPPEQIEVVIHSESVIHSMVEFVDGSVIAQLSPPDMKTPIQYALTYPERVQGVSRTLDISRPFSLNFEPPDLQRFPALRLAYDVARRRGTLGAVLNASNEVAVTAFASGKITLGVIPRVVERTIERHDVQTNPSLDDLLAADQWARRSATGFLSQQ